MSGTRGADERKVGSLRELSPAIEPARDLWPQIEARINAERSTAPAPQTRPARARVLPPRWLAAAAVVASVAVGVWIGRSLLPAARPGVQSPSSVRATVADAPTALDVAYVADPRYQRDRAALMKTLQARLAALPPAARAKVMASLGAIQRAKQDLENALGKDPGNALLQELLVNTYQDEMRVLTDVHEASDAGRGI
jgi:Tfp pilus assembly protein PilF